MGCVKNISADSYPAQGEFLGRDVEVCFDYDVSCVIKGKVIREDVEEPGLMLIQLENGWVIRSTECQYRLIESSATEEPADDPSSFDRVLVLYSGEGTLSATRHADGSATMEMFDQRTITDLIDSKDRIALAEFLSGNRIVE